MMSAGKDSNTGKHKQNRQSVKPAFLFTICKRYRIHLFRSHQELYYALFLNALAISTSKLAKISAAKTEPSITTYAGKLDVTVGT